MEFKERFDGACMGFGRFQRNRVWRLSGTTTKETNPNIQVLWVPTKITLSIAGYELGVGTQLLGCRILQGAGMWS
ncbi:MAG: hypothetical protein MZV63_04580 [Marinilabiliales bacterium]|nr:hypothetical protein [Marinilabiliales bacterium]